MAHDAATVAADLLALLRVRPGCRHASYAQPPERILGGYDTVLYGFRLANIEGSLGRPLILRIFDGGFGAFRARVESATQNAIAAQGYPCPRVLVTGDEDSIAGEHFTIMERVPGAPAIEAVLKPRLDQLPLLPRLPGIVAHEVARLHDLDSTAFAQEVASPDFDRQLQRLSVDTMLGELDDRVEQHQLDQLRPAQRWLTENRPPEPASLSICHGDFHLGNVLLRNRQVSGVIDWSGVRLTDPAFDMARNIVATLYAPSMTPRVPRSLSTLAWRAFSARQVAVYRRLRPLALSTLDYYEALVSLLYFSQGYAHALTSPSALETHPWASEPAAQSLARHFHAKTGITLGDRRRSSVT